MPAVKPVPVLPAQTMREPPALPVQDSRLSFRLANSPTHFNGVGTFRPGDKQMPHALKSN